MMHSNYDRNKTCAYPSSLPANCRYNLCYVTDSSAHGYRNRRWTDPVSIMRYDGQYYSEATLLKNISSSRLQSGNTLSSASPSGRVLAFKMPGWGSKRTPLCHGNSTSYIFLVCNIYWIFLSRNYSFRFFQLNTFANACSFLAANPNKFAFAGRYLPKILAYTYLLAMGAVGRIGTLCLAFRNSTHPFFVSPFSGGLPLCA